MMSVESGSDILVEGSVHSNVNPGSSSEVSLISEYMHRDTAASLAREDVVTVKDVNEGLIGHRGILFTYDPFDRQGRKSFAGLHTFEVPPTSSEFSLPSADAGDDPKNDMPGSSEKFHWRDAIYQSVMIQGFQHGYAMLVQEKTRKALKGPFWADYWTSVKAFDGWDDGNRFFTNYIAHPMQGGMTGFIFVQNHDRAKRQKFNESKQYWKDRLKAMAWSAAWSTNWEIGPISQSSIGNVGLYGKQGWVDTVITPTVGTGWLVMEEALDRYLIRHIDSKNRLSKIVFRSLLNPMRTVANILRFREPWYREPSVGR